MGFPALLWYSGGSAGIGAATAQAFSNSGATVTVSGRNITRLEGTISSLSGQAFAAVGDLNDLGQCREVVQASHAPDPSL
jgi:NADP-dependent 3-hydroxy acid dehydrogenase YdfG